MQTIRSSARAPVVHTLALAASNALSAIERSASAVVARTIVHRAEQSNLTQSEVRDLRTALQEREQRDGLAKEARAAAERGAHQLR